MTWTCMVCGRERIDSKITVTQRPLKGAEDGFPGTRVNVRHCKEEPKCVREARTADRWMAGTL